MLCFSWHQIVLVSTSICACLDIKLYLSRHPSVLVSTSIWGPFPIALTGTYAKILNNQVKTIWQIGKHIESYRTFIKTNLFYYDVNTILMYIYVYMLCLSRYQNRHQSVLVSISKSISICACLDIKLLMGINAVTVVACCNCN